jgi:tripartite-type tricarboxylate transporter receptor subunit TctC
MTRRLFLHTAGAGALAASMPAARAQTYPSRPLRLVVPFPPGGPTDVFARLYAAGLAQQLGQPVTVENKAGASGAIGSTEVMRAGADGHTLLFGTASTHGLYNLVQPKPQYDALQDFAYVGVLGGAPLVFAVAPSMPRTLKTVVIAARRNPGKYSYGSPGSGTMMHISAERLKLLTDTPSITHVPYKGSAPALQDLMGGNIEITVDTLGTLLAHHQAGRVRIVGVAAARRLALAPDIPTVAESADLPAPFEAMLWNVVAAPRDTPLPVLRALADATQRVMDDPALRARLEGQAIFPDLHLGQAAAQAYVRAEQAKWKPIVTSLGNLAGG